MKMTAWTFTFPIPLYDCIAHVSTEYSCFRDRIWRGKTKNEAAVKGATFQAIKKLTPLT